MRNSFLLIISFIAILIVYLTSSSIASVMMSGFTLGLGWLMALLFATSNKERTEMFSALLISFVVFTLATVLQYLDYTANYTLFVNEGRDNYDFFMDSQDGVGAHSIRVIFHECIIQNIHYENGGYYFYIKLIAYLAKVYSDGNHLLLQQLGTSLPSILSSVVIYGILAKYCPTGKVLGYTCYFMILSPLILHSVGIHRDAMIALFYFILIYLWLCKDFSWKVGFLQIVLAFILYFFRVQHGLFAISFVVVSVMSTSKRNRFVCFISIMALIAIVGATFLLEMISNNLADTKEYYEQSRAYKLSGLSTGIGRFIYDLPSPLKEIAQVFFLQLRFPPWLALSEAGNLPAIILGFLTFAVSFYWFYVFASTVFGIIKKGYKCLSKKLLYGMLLLLVFLFLSSSNLDSRRVVCMYPLMFVPFVFYREYMLSKNNILSFRQKYIIVYGGICLLYLIVKGIAG